MTKEELQLLIDKTDNPNIKKIYMNHLLVMKDEPAVCTVCYIDNGPETIEAIIIPEEDGE